MSPPVRRKSSTHQARAALKTLTARELEVLDRLSSGARSRTIAHELGITEPTVKRHLTNLYRKLGVTNRVEAVASFIRAQQRPSGRAPRSR